MSSGTLSFGAPIQVLPNNSVFQRNAIFHTNQVTRQRFITKIQSAEFDIAVIGQPVFLVIAKPPPDNRRSGDLWMDRRLFSIPAMNWYLAAEQPLYSKYFHGKAIRDDQSATQKRIRRESALLETLVEVMGIIELPNLWGFEDVRAGDYLCLQEQRMTPDELVKIEFKLGLGDQVTPLPKRPAGDCVQLVPIVRRSRPVDRQTIILGKAQKNQLRSFSIAELPIKLNNVNMISALHPIEVQLIE